MLQIQLIKKFVLQAVKVCLHSLKLFNFPFHQMVLISQLFL